MGAGGDSPGQSMRLLLVVDDAGDALLMEELLGDTDIGHTLRWVRTLADALTALAERTTDCVLLDLALPDSAGVDAVRAVCGAFPQTPVVALGGLADKDTGSQVVADGAQDYLVKGGFGPEVLSRALRYSLFRKQLERENAELQQGRLQARENARLERGLLPSPLLRSAALTVTSRYLPGREGTLLGGDFYDVVETADGVVHAVVGDVSGHGPDEAALGVSLRSAWRSLVLGGSSGPDLLDVLEQILVSERMRSDVFATCSTMTLDLRAVPKTAVVYLAGHHEPVLVSSTGARVPNCDLGIALGFLPGVRTWYPTSLSLPPAGALLLCTDGLIEGFNGPGHARLGLPGLVDLMSAQGGDFSDFSFLGAVVDHAVHINAGRHVDDTAVVWLEWS